MQYQRTPEFRTIAKWAPQWKADRDNIEHLGAITGSRCTGQASTTGSQGPAKHHSTVNASSYAYRVGEPCYLRTLLLP